MFDCGYKSQYMGGQRDKFVRYQMLLFAYVLVSQFIFVIFTFDGPHRYGGRLVSIYRLILGCKSSKTGVY